MNAVLPKYISWYARRNCFRIRFRKDGKPKTAYARTLDDAYSILREQGLPITQPNKPEYITYDPSNKRWRVRIREKGYDKWVSSHATREEAITARDLYLEKLLKQKQSTTFSALQFLRAF